MQDTTSPTLATATDVPFGLNALSLRPRKSPQAVQVLAIADATGSSGPFALGISQILSALSEQLPQRIAKVDFGLVASRDQDIGERDEALLSGGDGAALQHAVATIRFDGGGDSDETHFWSIRDAMGYAWDDGPMRRRAIVLLGSSHSKPVPGMTLEQLALELMRRRIAIFVVAPASTNLRRLAELTDGLFFELSNAPASHEVDRLVQRLTASMTQTLTGGGAVRTFSRITDRQRDRAWADHTATQHYLYATTRSGSHLLRIAGRYGIIGEEYRIFAVEVVGDVVLGLRSPSDVPMLVEHLLHRKGAACRELTRNVLEYLSPLFDPHFVPPPRDERYYDLDP